MLTRLTTWCFDRRRIVVAIWVAVLVATTILSGVAGGEHRVDYSMPGTDSATVRKLLDERFPEQAGDMTYVVAHAPDGFDAAARSRIDAALADIATADHVRGVDPAVPSPDGRTLLATVQLDAAVEAIPREAIHALMDRAAEAGTGSVQVELGGWPVSFAEGGEEGSEGIGLVVALLVLLASFGSALAAGVPIVMALFGLGVGSALAMLLARFMMLPDWGTQLATMIGIGVGIDYALFIVTRFRTGLASGASPRAAMRVAGATAGRSVLFAGITVVVSLLGLGVMGLDYLWATAIAMSLAVVCVLATSLTLLPAVLGFAGRRIDALRVPGVRGGRGRSERWATWSRFVQRRAVVFGLAGVTLLVALALPFLDLRFGFPDPGTGPTSLMSRRAYDMAAAGFGPGANGPLVVAVSATDGNPVGPVVAEVQDRLSSVDGVAAVLPPEPSADGGAALLTVVPTSGPQDEATEALVRGLRETTFADVPGGEVLVGGATALFIDEADYEGARLPWFIAAVLVVSFVVLLSVFRSLLVAVKAALLNLLAIAAAYGVIAMAAQGGWLGELIGIHEPTPVPVFIPILMFAILFGLSMDYEVFLLSRIREEHLLGASNSESVSEGIASTARVITAAAAIMVAVFGAFVLQDAVIAKLAGLGCAVAVFLDATVVRMMLVPATMELLGERNWWMPRWLDRRLPHLTVDVDVVLGEEPEPALVPAA